MLPRTTFLNHHPTETALISRNAWHAYKFVQSENALLAERNKVFIGRLWFEAADVEVRSTKHLLMLSCTTHSDAAAAATGRGNGRC